MHYRQYLPWATKAVADIKLWRWSAEDSPDSSDEAAMTREVHLDVLFQLSLSFEKFLNFLLLSRRVIL